MTPQLIDARTRELLRRLEFKSRAVVSGLQYGLHRSKRRGVSTEFLHHRAYAIGDSLRHIDWRVYARTERHYVKQYIEDSAATVWVLVDFSGSMDAEPETLVVDDKEVALPAKWEVASCLAAALCSLTMSQQDRCGLVLTSGDKPVVCSPGVSPAHYSFLTHRLVATPRAGAAGICAGLDLVEEYARAGSVVAILSDLSFPPEEAQQAIRKLRSNRHDVIVFHLITPRELGFEFNRYVDFACAEVKGLRQRVDATLLRRIYREEVDAFLLEWRRFCRRQRVDFVSVRTDADLTRVLGDYLRRRELGELVTEA